MDTALLRPHRRSTVKLWNFCVHAFYLRAVKKAEGGNEHTRSGVIKHSLLEAFQRGTQIPYGDDQIRIWNKLKDWVMGMEPEKKVFRTLDGLPIETCVVGAPSDALLECTFDNFSKNHGVDYKTGLSGYENDRYDSDFAYQAKFYVATAAPLMGEFFNFDFLFPYQQIEAAGIPSKTFSFSKLSGDYDRCWDEIKSEVLFIESQCEDRDADRPEDWEPDLSKCGRCLYVDSCQMRKAVEMDDKVIKWEGGLTTANFAKGVEILQTISMMEKYAKQAIEDFVSKNGNQVIGGKEYGFFKKPRRFNSLRSFDFAKALKASGFDMKEFYNRIKVAQADATEMAATAGLNPKDFYDASIGEVNSFGFINKK